MLFNLLLSFFVSFAQAEIKFEARVEPEVVGIGQPFNLYVNVTSDGEVLNVSDPQLPRMAGVNLLGQRQESSSIRRFENDQFKNIQSRTFIFTLVAMNPGAYTISPIKIRVNGGEKNISSTSFHVSDSAPSGPNTPPPSEEQDPFFPSDDDGLQQMDRMEEMFNQMLRRHGDPRLQRPTNEPKDNQGFFIQVELDKTKAYVGEHINAKWYLYTRGQVRDIDTLKYPDLNGFWKEDIEVATRLNFEAVNLNGVTYNRALLVAFALYPLKAGTAVIDPYTAKCTIITLDGLNLFGLAKPQVLTRSSQAVKIEVLPVPDPKPADFSGATGNFNMFGNIDATAFKTNTPFFYKLRFEGKGNAKIIELPKIEAAEGIELYDKKSTTGFEKNGTSRKEFELVFIPRKAGNVNIPRISISFFNPQTKTFYQKSNDEIPINVELSKDDPGVAPKKMEHKEGDPGEIRALPQIVAEFHEPMAWGNYFNTYTWLFSYGLAALFLLGKAGREFGWWEKKDTLETKFNARVKNINGFIGQDDWRKVGQEVINTMYFVLGEITGLGGASYEINRLLAEAPPSIRNELSEPIKKLLEEAEILGFAPEAAVGVRKDKANLKRTVTEMEKVLNRGIKLYRG